MQYRDHTIEPDYIGYKFFPTNEGRNEDYDWNGDSWKNCGNVSHANTISQAKREIDDKIFDSTSYEVVMHNGTRDERSYPFLWLEDAMNFCKLWGATLVNKFDSI